MKKCIFGLTIILVLGALILSVACKTPARFEVISLDITPEEIAAGERITIEATVENIGKTDGKYHAVLLVNGAEVEAKDIFLTAGAKQDISFQLIESMTGTYKISLGSLTNTLKVLKPAEFVITSHSITPNPAKVGENVEIKIEVQNLGEAEGTYSASLTIDREIIETKQTVLDGGAKEIISFILSRNSPGTYEIEINEVRDAIKIIQPVRLPNGTFLQKKLSGGLGELTIENGLDLDAVVILVDSKTPRTPLIALYIRSNASCTIKGIRDGAYIIYFSHGEDWDNDEKKFMGKTIYERFKDELQFEETEDVYTTWDITLHSVVGGTAETEDLSEEQFPNIE
ncbi:MAG: hypothetical protein JSV54_07290 [Chloroflexota bacterium]|nr:MAG: hypothetical protein JSV54_07290 [Chloroflexota bacterium]